MISGSGIDENCSIAGSGLQPEPGINVSGSIYKIEPARDVRKHLGIGN